MFQFSKRAGLLLAAGALTLTGANVPASAGSPTDASCRFTAIGKLAQPTQGEGGGNVGGVNYGSEYVYSTSLIGAIGVCSATPSATGNVPAKVPVTATATASTPVFTDVHITCNLSNSGTFTSFINSTLVSNLPVTLPATAPGVPTTATVPAAPVATAVAAQAFATRNSVVDPTATVNGVGAVVNGVAPNTPVPTVPTGIVPTSLNPGSYDLTCTLVATYVTNDTTATPGNATPPTVDPANPPTGAPTTTSLGVSSAHGLEHTLTDVAQVQFLVQ